MAEFLTGDLVWFDPDELGYCLPGVVVEFHRQGNVLTIDSHAEEKPGQYTLENNGSVKRRGDLPNDGVADMITLNDLSEASLLWNVKLRYEMNRIYTYVGSILVAVNPYKMFDIYGLDNVKKYEGKVLGVLPPHLFALGSAAYGKMVKDTESQVVVISGESGAGKTECTRCLNNYLALVNKSPSNLITEQILEASPLLESFGNAKTIKNDNSSRFGKYLQVHFSGGNITGAKITEYLLEKSRIVTQNQEERNYHVFYEMLRGLSKESKDKYGLLSAEKYFYLNQGGNCNIKGKNDAEDFNALLSAMQILGITNEEQDGIMGILASVLHLGNVYFHRKQLKHGQEGVEIGSDAEVLWAAHLLQINADGIRRSLTTRTTEARNEKMTTPLTIDQSLDSRDAIAKVLYSNLFSWLVSRVNKIVYKGEGTCISILDIFGFEDFKENSFEQLSINFANESLQHFMNKHIFKLEQQEYLKEKLEWTPINYEDNLGVIKLLSLKPVGILHLLDDESNFPKATDHSFLEKAHYNHALNENYLRPRMISNEFGVRHFAGSVWYNVEGFLDKNRDVVRPDVLKLLSSSRNPMISKMFLAKSESRTKHKEGRFVTMKPRAPTVSARFADSLNNLIELMSKCNPWFIRCIKPNNSKSPMEFDIPVVLEQLRYSGILQTIQIRKLGYPVRMTYVQFTSRYKCILQYTPRLTDREICRNILNIADESRTNYQAGSTKIFLREILEQKLEARRYELLHVTAIKLQKTVRGYLARKRYKNMKKGAVTIQSYWRMKRERREFLALRKASIITQSHWRMKRERKRYAIMREEFKKRKVAQKRNVVSGLNHLEIPAELAFVFSKLDEWNPAHTDRNLIKIVGQVCSKSEPRYFPQDIDSKLFSKYVQMFFKNQTFGMKREPITVPFLKDSPQDSLIIFKMILRFMNGDNERDMILANYIINKGIINPNLKDEIIIQTMNQTKDNNNPENLERGWILMSSLLSCLKPSPPLFNYVLKYVSDFNSHYAPICQDKMLSSAKQTEEFISRSHPPCLLEWRGIKNRVNMSLPIQYFDEDLRHFSVNSWTTCGDLADLAAHERGIDSSGWTLELDDDELASTDFVLDAISWMELPPVFPTSSSRGGYGLFGYQKSKRSEISRRPNGIPPEPPKQDRFDEYKLSSSVLNERYFQAKKPKSKSLDNLLCENNPNALGLSNSKLNERYHSIENVDRYYEQSSRSSSNSSTKDEAEIEAVDNRSAFVPVDHERDNSDFVIRSRHSRSGNPRFIKASSASKRSSIAGSYSSRAYIERYGGNNEYGSGVKSSALSDTSEAPSLASHVRRVRVPSQASDVDQFLDDLFSPVLDGNLDDLIDARSLVTSIKGGGGVVENVQYPINSVGNPPPFQSQFVYPTGLQNAGENIHRAFLQSAMAQNIQIQQQLIAQNNALQQLLHQQLQIDQETLQEPPRSRLTSPTVESSNINFTQDRAQPPPKNNSKMDHHGSRPQNPKNVFGNVLSELRSSKGGGDRETSIPPPPPLPPDLIESGSRPCCVYGRAKTVRIGKWRWPPKKEDLEKAEAEGDNFSEFKMRQEKRKQRESTPDEDSWGPITPVETSMMNGHAQQNGHHNNTNNNFNSAHSNQIEESQIQTKPTPPPVQNGFHGPSGPNGKKFITPRPFGDAVGKLRISSEMREKLEQVTSIRGRKESDNKASVITPKKLNEDRKSLLAEKLGGGFPPPPPVPPTVAPIPSRRSTSPQMHMRKMQTQNYDEIDSNFGVAEPVEFDDSSEFLHPMEDQQMNKHFEQELITKTRLFEKNQSPHFSYNRVPWVLRLRKEVFLPGETLSNPLLLHLIFVQVVRDTLRNHLRITVAENTRMRSMLEGYGVDSNNVNSGQHKINVKKNIVEIAKSWSLYFVRFFQVQTPSGSNQYLAVNGSGVKVVKRDSDSLAIHEFFSYEDIDNATTRANYISINLTSGHRIVFSSSHTTTIKDWVSRFAQGHARAQSQSNTGVEFNNSNNNSNSQQTSPPPQVQSVPSEEEEYEEEVRVTDDGKHSLLQFAMIHFRQDKFSMDTPSLVNKKKKSKKNSSQSDQNWTWKEQISLVKYSNQMIDKSLLPLEEPLSKLAMECFQSILIYMGDLSLPKGASEVECVYTILRNCHNNPTLRDELYCQIMKQTTNNSKTAQRGWRLFTILGAYFTCSDVLKPYLFKYLESSAYDKRRAFHGTALVSLQNLRKTFKYGGRRNVPSVEEITAITAGRNAKRQIFRLPGGTQRVINIKATTVVQDVIDEMCGMLNIRTPEEREEFSVYCIVEGDTFTMPLQKDEYILDVTTELFKNEQVFYLIFCRSVWFFDLRLDSPIYIEVVFNQVAPDYLEGLLLTMPGQTIPQNIVYDIGRVAALLHRAADLCTPPTLKETKYLLPKPSLAARDIRPNQWVSIVNDFWADVCTLSPIEAKGKVLEILQKWELFGSSFFTVKRIADPQPSEEYIMALNRNGVHFLDLITHETLMKWDYSEVISTRKVKSDDGILFLDIKFGNLMQQKIARIQTDHAHEISRLIRQYIHIQKCSKPN